MKRLPLILFALLLCLSTASAGEIHDAVESGNIGQVKELIESNSDLLESKNNGGNTPLLLAALNGQIELFRYLLDKGANINAINNRGSSILNLAAYNGQIEMMDIILELGFDIDFTSITGFTPLIHATFMGQADAVKFLIDKGASLSIFDSTYGGAPIHWSCVRANDETRDILLSYGADLNLYSPSDSSTPIIWATYNGNLDATKWLVHHGVDPGQANPQGWTTLHNAAMRGQVEIAEFLLDKGVDYNAADQHNTTPFMMAMQSGSIDMAQLFIEHGADVNAANADGETPLQTAVFGENIELIRLLISKGANVNVSSAAGSTPLFNSTYRDNPDITDLLLESGAQANTCNSEGYSPLNGAIIRGYDEIAELLVKHDADLGLRDNIYERTALHWAAIKGNMDISRLLVENGANINIEDKNQNTPLYYAAKYGNKDVADLLEAHGGKAKKMVQNYGWSPLLNRKVDVGEAYIWYMGHCGFAIQTANNFLIFDYWNYGKDPALPSLANGHVNPDEIAGQNVYVFVTHDHQDHFDSTIFSWDNQLENCTYIMGFRPELLPQYQDSGYTGPSYQYIAPRTDTVINNLEIVSIESNDSGVGFLIKVDGLEIYHAGDHAGWRTGQREGFTKEIDFLADHISSLDFAFVNVTGCHVHDTISLAEGTKYTLEKLQPRLWYPTHGSDREYVYKPFVKKADAWNLPSKSACPENRGDRFHYQKGGI